MNKRQGTLKESFVQFAWDRIEKAQGETCNDPRFIDIREKHFEAFEKFKAMITPEAYKFYLDEVEPTESEMECYDIERIYLQGVKDGAELKQVLELGGDLNA